MNLSHSNGNIVEPTQPIDEFILAYAISDPNSAEDDEVSKGTLKAKV